MNINHPTWLPASLQLNADDAKAALLAMAMQLIICALMIVSFDQLGDIALKFHRPYSGDDYTSWYLPFINWDGQHYLMLAEHGWNLDYGKTGGRHFYPLYPLLMQAVGAVLPLPLALAGVLLNFLFTAGACIFIARLCRHFGAHNASHNASRNAYLAILLTLSFPTAFYTSVVYSEALFMFLSLGFVYHLLVTRSPARLVYLALLPLSRGSAVFMVGGLLLMVGMHYWLHRQSQTNAPNTLHKKSSSKPAGRKARQKARRELGTGILPIDRFDWRYYALCAPAFLLGIAAYFGFFALATGNAFAGFEARALLGHGESILNVFNPINFLVNNLFAPMPEGFFAVRNSGLDRIVVWLMIAGAVYLGVRKQWQLLCFALPLIYAHASISADLLSYARYALTAAPFIAIGIAANARRVWLGLGLCGGLMWMQIICAYSFALNSWVG